MDTTFMTAYIDSPALRNLAHYYKRQIYTTDTHAFCCALATIACLTQNKVRLIYSDNVLTSNALNIYWLNIAPSIIGRKSYTGNTVIQTVRQLMPEYFATNNFTFEGLFERLHSDEHKSCLLYTDEFKSIVGDKKEYNAGIMTDITAGYNGDFWERTLVKYGDKKGGKASKSIGNYQLNYLACTTPDWMFDNINKESFVGGFLNRFVMTYLDKDDPVCKINLEDAEARKTFLDKIPSFDLPKLIVKLKQFAGNMSLAKGYIQLSAEASQHLNEFKTKMIRQYHSDDGTHDISIEEAIINRSTENIKRIACLISLFGAGGFKPVKKIDEWNETAEVAECSGDAMLLSIEFFKTIINQTMKAIDHHFQISYMDNKAKKVMQSIENFIYKQEKPIYYTKGTAKYLLISRSELTRISHLSGSQKNELIEHLLETEQLREVPIEFIEDKESPFYSAAKKKPKYYYLPEPVGYCQVMGLN